MTEEALYDGKPRAILVRYIKARPRHHYVYQAAFANFKKRDDET